MDFICHYLLLDYHHPDHRYHWVLSSVIAEGPLERYEHIRFLIYIHICL